MTTKPDDLRPWLGDAWDELTADQLDRLCDESDRIAVRHPDTDDEHLRQAALSAAVQYVLGETTVTDAGAALRAARRALDDAMAASKQVAAMACADGMDETKAAPAAGIDRMTLRRVLGKL